MDPGDLKPGKLYLTNMKCVAHDTTTQPYTRVLIKNKLILYIGERRPLSSSHTSVLGEFFDRDYCYEFLLGKEVVFMIDYYVRNGIIKEME